MVALDFFCDLNTDQQQLVTTRLTLSWALEILGEKHPVFVKLSDIGKMQAKHRSLIQHITLDHFDEVYALCKDGE